MPRRGNCSSSAKMPLPSSRRKRPTSWIRTRTLIQPSCDRSSLMRAILEAKIALLEDLAGKLKGLSEMKQRIADEVDYPPKNPENFRQYALEHKQDAIAALTAAHTLKAVLAERTKAKQIALMRHY